MDAFVPFWYALPPLPDSWPDHLALSTFSS
jgi:hypothetical protein